MGRNRTLLFAILATAQFIQLMQFSMVTVGFSSMIDDLNAPLRWVGWVLSIFLLGQVIAQPVSGWLTNRIGSRRVYVGALAVGALGSLGAALAPSIETLIAMRVIQGAAAGFAFPTAIAIVAELYGENRARPIALQSAIMPMSSAVGPLVGGALIELFSWRATFFVNPPILLALLVLVVLLFPPGRRQPKRPIDVPGIVLIALSMTILIYALTEIGRRSGEANLPLAVAGLAIAVAFVALLYRREVRTPHPVVDMSLVLRREFVAINLLSFLIQIGHLGVFSVLPLYGEAAYGLSASETGALLGPRSVAQGLGGAMATLLLFRAGYRRLITTSLFGMGSALFLISLGMEDPSLLGLTIPSFIWVILLASCIGFSMGLNMPAMANAALDIAPDRIPEITGLRGTFGALGGIVGVTLVATIVSRASSTAGGIEFAFGMIAVVYVISSLLVLRIPSAPRRRTTTEVAVTPADAPTDTVADTEPRRAEEGPAPSEAGPT